MVKLALGLAITGLLGLAWLIGSSPRPTSEEEANIGELLPSEWQTFQDDLERQKRAHENAAPTDIAHDKPPPPSLFVDDRRLQERYDAEAQPGQFVTPPRALR